MIRADDLLRFSLRALLRQRFRTVMQLLAMSIGVLAVVVLTGIGEGGRRYINQEFAIMGKDILAMLPGRKETTGGMPPMTGEGARPITLEDVDSLLRIPGVERVSAVVAGNSRVVYGNLNRSAPVLGADHLFFQIRQLAVSRGQGLPDIPRTQASPVCVIGNTLRQELFANQPALGQWLRVDHYRCRVIGILAERGMGMGMDFSESLLMPVASAMQLYNTEGVFRVMIDVRHPAEMPRIIRAAEQLMQQRHDGHLDVTLMTPDSLLQALDNILGVITLAIAGIAAISLIVAGVLVMNMTLISVTQRTAEIGLLKALGASAREVRQLFVLEAMLLSLAGAVLGVLLANLLLWFGRQQLPSVPLFAPWWATLAAVAMAALCGLLFAWLPASKAARLPPVAALLQQHGK